MARLFASEPDTAGYGVKIDTFRYVDWPLAGDVGRLVITGLDPSRDYFYGVISTARDSSGNWVWSAWEIVQDAGSTPPAQSSPTPSATPSTTPVSVATPDASLTLEVTAELAGYYSSGEAGVDVTLSLSDTQHPWREGVQTISFVCRQGTEVVAGCSGELKVTLLGDGGSDTQSATLRTPMGSVSFEFDFGGTEPLTLPFDVPQRILGVERDVWECFRDEPDTLNPSEDNNGYYGDCAGWGRGNSAMWKWNQDIPVNVWTTGLEDYVATLDETLYELSPLLGLDFVRVDSGTDATLKAYMGISKSQVVSAGFPEFCAGEYIMGCGGPDWITHSGVVESGIFGVWRYLDESGWWRDAGLLDTLIKHVTIHEALHALVPIFHRDDAASIMNTRKSLSLPTLSRMDEALIRLHQHRLVKPGMTMSEIERLIVFREDLLDSPPSRELDGYELVRSAFATLQEADSARFRISGGWRSSRCNRSFGWANYEIADFGSSVARLVHFEDGRKSHFIIAPKSRDGDREYWIEESGQWKEVGQDIFSDQTSWRQGFSGPHVMFAAEVRQQPAAGQRRGGGWRWRASRVCTYGPVMVNCPRLRPNPLQSGLPAIMRGQVLQGALCPCVAL